MSALEEDFAHILDMAHIVGWEREYRFHPTRKWRFDFAWPRERFAIEVEGVVPYGKGRHQTFTGYTKDAEKYNEAVMHGWSVMRFTQPMLKDKDIVKKMTEIAERFELEIEYW